VIVSGKNGCAVGNIQNLCIRFLSNEGSNVSPNQSAGIIRDVLLPIYFGKCETADSKLSLEAIKQCMGVNRGRGLEEQLSKLFLSCYQRYWEG
jgi:hypothetical protein